MKLPQRIIPLFLFSDSTEKPRAASGRNGRFPGVYRVPSRTSLKGTIRKVVQRVRDGVVGGLDGAGVAVVVPIQLPVGNGDCKGDLKQNEPSFRFRNYSHIVICPDSLLELLAN